MPEGTKNDAEKLRFDLIPPEFERAIADILTYGAAKYEDRNWEKGMDWSRPYAALRRHLNAWQMGEIIDPESGRPHLVSVLANAMFLYIYEMRSIGNDNVHISQDRGQVGDVQRGEEDRPEELRTPLGWESLDDFIRKIRSLGEFRGFEGKFGEVLTHFRPDVQG